MVFKYPLSYKDAMYVNPLLKKLILTIILIKANLSNNKFSHVSSEAICSETGCIIPKHTIIFSLFICVHSQHTALSSALRLPLMVAHTISHSITSSVIHYYVCEIFLS